MSDKPYTVEDALQGRKWLGLSCPNIDNNQPFVAEYLDAAAKIIEQHITNIYLVCGVDSADKPGENTFHLCFPNYKPKTSK